MPHYYSRTGTNIINSPAYTYLVTQEPVNLPISGIELKQHLKIEDILTEYVAATTYAADEEISFGGYNYTSLQSANTGNQPDESPTYWKIFNEDAYLQEMIKTARDSFELYTNIILINTEFLTLRDCFNSCCFELRKSRFQELVSFKYLVDDVLTDVDSSLYYTTKELPYSKIVLKNEQSWPDDIDVRLQAIEITFVAGFGEDSTDVPSNVKSALLEYIAFIFSNRGDCSQSMLFGLNKRFFSRFKRPSIYGGTWSC